MKHVRRDLKWKCSCSHLPRLVNNCCVSCVDVCFYTEKAQANEQRYTKLKEKYTELVQSHADLLRKVRQTSLTSSSRFLKKKKKRLNKVLSSCCELKLKIQPRSQLFWCVSLHVCIVERRGDPTDDSGSGSAGRSGGSEERDAGQGEGCSGGCRQTGEVCSGSSGLLLSGACLS